jgi:hypothetical protein
MAATLFLSKITARARCWKEGVVVGYEERRTGGWILSFSFLWRARIPQNIQPSVIDIVSATWRSEEKNCGRRD